MIFRTQGHVNIPGIKKSTVQLYDEERKPVMNCAAHRMKSPSPVKGKKPAKKRGAICLAILGTFEISTDG
jgi:hypothetical protein